MLRKDGLRPLAWVRSNRLFRRSHPVAGQGLVEYSLLLTLVGLAVIAGLSLFGETTRDVYCQIILLVSREGPPPAECGEPDVVTITQATYNAAQKRVVLKATSDSGYDPEVSLTASPGGAMSPQGDHYALTVTGVAGCPCTIEVTSSRGGSDSVTVS